MSENRMSENRMSGLANRTQLCPDVLISDVYCPLLSKSQPLHQHIFLRKIQQHFQNHLKGDLDILSRTLHIMKNTQPSTPQPNSSLRMSSIKSQVKPSLKPLEAGIRDKTLCRHPHHSVRPTIGNHLPEEGGQKKVAL